MIYVVGWVDKKTRRRFPIIWKKRYAVLSLQNGCGKFEYFENESMNENDGNGKNVEMTEFRPKRLVRKTMTEINADGSDEDKKPSRRFTSRSERRRIQVETTGCIDSDDEDYGIIDTITSRKSGEGEDVEMTEFDSTKHEHMIKLKM